jgi:hypothetical protein
MSEAVQQEQERNKPRLDLLKEKHAQLRRQIEELEAKEKQKKRKDDTREKVLVGAAFLADVGAHPETRARIVDVLRRAITAPRDREFLASRGWL